MAATSQNAGPLARGARGSQALDFLQGGGVMGARMRAKDWSQTPLGSPENWPQSLKTVTRIVLTSRYAMWMLWGPDLTFFCNDSYLPTLGVKQEWALGSRSDKVWEEIWPEIGPRIQTVLRTNTATYDENLQLFLERSGYAEETYHTFSYSPLADDDGAVVGMLCVVTEETDKVIGERRLSLLGRLAASMTGVLREQDVVTVFTRTCSGHPDLPFLLPFLKDNQATDEHAHARLQHEEAVRAGSFAADMELYLQTYQATLAQPQTLDLPAALREKAPAGAWQKPAVQIAIVPFAQGGSAEAAGFLAVGINPFRPFDPSYMRFLELLAGQIGASLTNARAHEAERKRATALAELDRAKTVFFSNISHEFRTPLTLMLGPLGDALHDAHTRLPDVQQDRIAVAHRNALRLLRLVNALLDFSRIEAGRIEARYAPVDLSTLTAELASNFESAVKRVGLKLVISCSTLGQPVYVDPEMWEKIVLNLISNAFKFTFEGHIAVSLHRVGDMAELSVEDTGVGVPETDLPRLFERFHRVEGQRSRTHEGSGIGLALVQELVNLHGGAIAVDSTPGKGTIFKVDIPLGKAHLPPERIVKAAGDTAMSAVRAGAFAQEAMRWSGDADILDISADGAIPDAPIKSTARILLVDDNADMRAYVQRLLKGRWEIELAEDGLVALEAIRRRRPDLVLSDIMMPRLDGFGLVTAIRQDLALRDLPVILLSARAGEEAQVEGLDAGANDYLVKPFSARELIGRINANLDVARIRRENTDALKRRTEQYETLLNAAPVGAFLVDGDFRIREVNPAARPAFGDIPDLIGRDLDEVVHIQWESPYADEIVRIFRHTLNTGESHIEPERIERRADRNELEYYEWQIHRILLPEGGFGIVCYFRDISAQVTARQRQRLMIDELNHRVKNTLATIQSIAMQTLRTAGNTRDARVALESRLLALSKAHDVLTREHWERANVQEIVQASVAPYGGASLDSRFDIEGPEVFVQPKAALALSLALHELATNAVKYGALSNSSGRIALTWRIFDGQFFLQWREAGGPPVAPPQNRGFGSRLIEKGVAQDLGGSAQLDFAPEGVTFALAVPLEEMVKRKKRESQARPVEISS